MEYNLKYDLKKIVDEKINSDIISEKAVEALVYEVSISPKAGLVTRYSNGSHKDMDYFMFQKSAFSLKQYFKNCYDYRDKYSLNEEAFFLNLRTLGKEAEREMFKATNNVNTHKGTIFSMGILIAILAAALKEKEVLTLNDLVAQIKKTCKPLEIELREKIDNTSGEKIFKQYGIKGARGLALSGYELVLNDGIKKLFDFTEYLDLETSCILLLFYYIAKLDDTNIINRSNLETLKAMQQKSFYIFKKYMSIELKGTEKLIRKDMEALNREFIEKNISPGGSADLLILTVFMYFIMR